MRTLYFATAGLILVAAVIEDSYGMVFRDELTGLPARRALNETLQKVGRRYTVAMVDIDHFKKFNDRHGHDVGDQVLRMVASRLAKVNGGGRPFRYGGEEFTVLFPGKGVKEALPHLEELRESVAGAGFTLRHSRRPVRKPKGKPAKHKGDQKFPSMAESRSACWRAKTTACWQIAGTNSFSSAIPISATALGSTTPKMLNALKLNSCLPLLFLLR